MYNKKTEAQIHSENHKKTVTQEFQRTQYNSNSKKRRRKKKTEEKRYIKKFKNTQKKIHNTKNSNKTIKLKKIKTQHTVTHPS